MNQINIIPSEESIHILNAIYKTIMRQHIALCSLPDYKVEPDIVMTLNTTNFSYGCILVISYLDEYHKHFMPNLNKDEKAIFSQYYKKIKEVINLFPGLKDYRNQVLAHNLRNKNKSVPMNINLSSYKVPQTIIEFALIIEAIKLLTFKINKTFPNAFHKVSQHLAKNQNPDSVKSKKLITPKEAEEIIIKLHKELQSLEN